MLQHGSATKYDEGSEIPAVSHKLDSKRLAHLVALRLLCLSEAPGDGDASLLRDLANKTWLTSTITLYLWMLAMYIYVSFAVYAHTQILLFTGSSAISENLRNEIPICTWHMPLQASFAVQS